MVHSPLRSLEYLVIAAIHGLQARMAKVTVQWHVMGLKVQNGRGGFPFSL